MKKLIVFPKKKKKESTLRTSTTALKTLFAEELSNPSIIWYQLLNLNSNKFYTKEPNPIRSIHTQATNCKLILYQQDL